MPCNDKLIKFTIIYDKKRFAPKKKKCDFETFPVIINTWHGLEWPGMVWHGTAWFLLTRKKQVNKGRTLE